MPFTLDARSNASRQHKVPQETCRKRERDSARSRILLSRAFMRDADRESLYVGNEVGVISGAKSANRMIIGIFENLWEKFN